jgi:hypothetical protein
VREGRRLRTFQNGAGEENLGLKEAKCQGHVRKWKFTVSTHYLYFSMSKSRRQGAEEDIWTEEG